MRPIASAASGPEDGSAMSKDGSEADEGECEPREAAPRRAPPRLSDRPVHQRHVRLALDLSACKYDAVRDAALAMGWRVLEPDEGEEGGGGEWNVYWTDVSVSLERVMRLRPLQRINHFPGMLELARKAGTARNLNRMLARYPDEYAIFPPTWLLPADLTDFKRQFTGRRNRTFIVKPSRGCQGKDIVLTRSLDGVDCHGDYVAQRYMAAPYLLDGYKFDLRIYVLLTSVEPLRVYLHREGMVRICTQRYAGVSGANLGQQTMHLTNYAINRHAEGYTAAATEADETAHKRLLSSVLSRLAALGEDVPTLVQQIRECCVKALIAVQPHLAHTYRACRQRTVGPAAPSCGRAPPRTRAHARADSRLAARLRAVCCCRACRRTAAPRASSCSASTCCSTAASSRTCSR